jgi:hypothetical protein
MLLASPALATPEPIAIAELSKAPIGLGECLLRDVFRVLSMTQHSVGHSEGQGGRLDEPRLEFALDVLVSVHEW